MIRIRSSFERPKTENQLCRSSLTLTEKENWTRHTQQRAMSQPIPLRRKKNTEIRSEATTMAYDMATWRMYHRLMQHRKQRTRETGVSCPHSTAVVCDSDGQKSCTATKSWDEDVNDSTGCPILRDTKIAAELCLIEEYGAIFQMDL